MIIRVADKIPGYYFPKAQHAQLGRSPKSEEVQKDYVIELANYSLCLLHHHPITPYNISTTPSIISRDTPIYKVSQVSRKIMFLL
jgi:hypothetical protein